MNNEKAREYFSAHAEGTLDLGLSQSFEAKLKADAGLQAEYDQFKATLEQLDALRFEKVEIPFDLNDRISAAVDRSIYDSKRTSSPSWTMWLRNLAFAGLAASAIFGAYYTINLRGDNVAPASPIGIRPTEQIEYRKTQEGVEMSYRPMEKHTVVVKGGSEGDKTIDVDRNGWLNELTNSGADAAVFTIEVKGATPATTVVVPGAKRSKSTIGQGVVLDLAKAVANRYGLPVVIKSADVSVSVSWNLESVNASEEVGKALNGLPFSVDVRESGIIHITGH